jgi:hypothetical protein
MIGVKQLALVIKLTVIQLYYFCRHLWKTDLIASNLDVNILSFRECASTKKIY